MHLFRKKTLYNLNQQTLNLLLNRHDLRLELGALVDGDGAGDDRTRHAARTAQGLLGAHEHVRHVLVLAQQRQMEDDLERFGVRGHHDKLREATVQRLGGLVGAATQLLVVDRLLDQRHNLGREGLVRQRVGLRVHLLGLWGRLVRESEVRFYTFAVALRFFFCEILTRN